MVAPRLYRWAAWTLLLFMPCLWAAPLTLEFPAQMEHGRTVRAQLTSTQLQHPIDTLDLAPLTPWFVVERRGAVEVDKRHATQRQLLWLTPREAGEFNLLPLSLAGIEGGAQAVRISPARDGKSGELIEPRFPSLPGRAWARQQLVYAVVVESDRRFLRLTAESAGLEGFEVLAMPQQVEAIDGGKRYRHTAGWLLFASGAGNHQIRLPALRYGREGVVSHRFYPPPQAIEIEPLPDYLPPGLAVGEVRLEGAERPWHAVRTHELGQRSFTLITRGVPAKWWRPPAIEVSVNGTVQLYATELERSEVIDADGLAVRYRYTLPLTIESSGWHSLGPLDLSYFEPQTGRLLGQPAVIALPLALHLWQEIVLWLLLALVLWVAARAAMRFLGDRYRYLSGYRRALRQLHSDQDLVSLRRALNQVAIAEGWHGNLSLMRWSRRWQTCHPRIDVSHWMQRYERSCYGGAEDDVDELRAQLIHVLQSRLGPWRGICEFRLTESR